MSLLLQTLQLLIGLANLTASLYFILYKIKLTPPVIQNTATPAIKRRNPKLVDEYRASEIARQESIID